MINFNGNIQENSAVTIENNRGFLYGDAVFETLRVLNNKVLFLKKENDGWLEDNKLNKEIILEKNKTIEIYKSENDDLKKENKRLKTKNGLYNIISALIIVPLTYIALTK
jgi:hypothetical protein